MCEEDQIHFIREEDRVTLFNREDKLRLETWAIKYFRPVPLMCEEDQIHFMREEYQITLLIFFMHDLNGSNFLMAQVSNLRLSSLLNKVI